MPKVNACPQCGNELKIPEHGISNMRNYQNPIVINTLCCGRAITARPRMAYVATVYIGNKETDDWGEPIKKN